MFECVLKKNYSPPLQDLKMRTLMWEAEHEDIYEENKHTTQHCFVRENHI